MWQYYVFKNTKIECDKNYVLKTIKTECDKNYVLITIKIECDKKLSSYKIRIECGKNNVATMKEWQNYVATRKQMWKNYDT